MNLTQHFTVAESIVTSTGIDNMPVGTAKERVLTTAYNMEIVRAVLRRNPIKINSWYRSPAVNKAVGGSSKSEHLLGAAVDFVCPTFGSPLDICKTLVAHAHILNYNQLIYEITWVHISFPPDGQVGKKEVLTYRNNRYLQGIQP